MRENRFRLIRLMRALNRIDGQYYRVERSLKMKESLFVLLYACAEGEPRSQWDICGEWYIPRTTLNTAVKEQEAAGACIDDGLVEGLERFSGQLEREFGGLGEQGDLGETGGLDHRGFRAASPNLKEFHRQIRKYFIAKTISYPIIGLD